MTSKPSGSKLFFQHPKWEGKNQTIVNDIFQLMLLFKSEKAIDVYNGWRLFTFTECENIKIDNARQKVKLFEFKLDNDMDVGRKADDYNGTKNLLIIYCL